MADKLIPSEFTPSGGLNQDDSMTTPDPALEGGVSLFQHGDYRYAQNMRIGSSREDSFGDGEIIKSTKKVDGYFIRGGQFVNPSFVSSIAPWQQILFGPGWSWAVANVVGILPDDPSILYQPYNGSNQSVFQYSYSMVSSSVSNFLLQAVFLNGLSILGTQDVDNRTGSLVDIFTGSVILNIPNGCDHIGFRVTGIKIGPFQCVVDFAQVSGWINSSKPSGVNKTIGKYEDNEFLRIYNCLYDTNVIRYYDIVTNSVYEILRWTGLKWSDKSFVKMAKLDNWMAITDRVNPPRLIDTNTIADLMISLGSNFQEFHISFHKWSPVAAPIVRRQYDGSIDNSDKLKNKMWQFSYRYMYKGNLMSRWSTVSSAANIKYADSDNDSQFRPITSIGVNMPGLFLDESGIISQVNFFDHGNLKCLAAIDNIQIAVRDGINGLWRLWKTITPNAAVSEQFFTGDVDNTPLSTDDFDQPYDTVPLLSGTVEAIDNRFVFADNMDEYEPSSIQVDSVSVAQQKTDDDTWWLSTTPDQFSSISNVASRQLRADINYVTPRTFKSRGIYKLGIQYLYKTGARSLVYTAENWIYNIPSKTEFSPTNSEPKYALSFRFVPGTKPPKDAVAYQIVRTNCLNISSFMYGACNQIQPIIDDLNGYISGLTKSSDSFITAFRDHFLNANLITGKDFSDYLDVLDNNPIYTSIVQNIRKNTTTTTVTKASRIFIDIRNWYNASKKTAANDSDNPFNNLLYNYRPGDRVRFIASSNPNPTAPTAKKIYDVKILDFTGDGIIAEKPSEIQWLPTEIVSGGISDDYLIEVYTPKEQKDSDFIFYEVGEWYPVLFAGSDSRSWSKSDWTYTNNAGVTASVYGHTTVYNKFPFYLGDCTVLRKFIYYNFKPNGAGILYSRQIPSMNNLMNETYGRWERATGRAYPSYRQKPVQKFKPTQARFGGKIVEESFINNLNRMQDADQFIYPSEYGRIRDLINTQNAQVESVGSVLLAIGEREVWSIYVNRTTSEDLSGRTQVLLSDKVLGSYNSLLGSYGTFNPESVTKNRGRVYWWCAIYGSWVRYGRDGLTAISDNKMRTWFKQLSDLLFSKYLTLEIPRVISGYDSFNEELVTRIDHSSLPEEFRGYTEYKGVLFSEKDIRWKSIINYDPDMFGHIGNVLAIFKNGDVFIHEAGDDYLTFFGTKNTAKIEPVFNDFMKAMKTWQSLSVISTDQWSVERILSEYRGTKTIQESNIPLSQVKDKEDTYYAPFFRDQNSLGTLYKGNRMRSKAIKTLLVLDNSVTGRSLLHYVQAEFISSPKTP